MSELKYWDAADSAWKGVGGIIPGGPPGPANTLSIGTVDAGATADATITGTSPTQTLNLTLPKGDKGDAATVGVGSTTTGAAGTSASVVNSGTADAAILDFTIPAGANGLGVPAGGTTNQVLAKNSSTDNDASWKSVADIVYPVGCIYMSVVNTSPATLFGGTWSVWGTGRVAVGVDTAQTEFNTVEKTGGEKNHTLTAGEMPWHTHGQYVTANSGPAIRRDYQSDGSASNYDQGQQTSAAGGGGAHNNLQPYITCYMWKRVS